MAALSCFLAEPGTGLPSSSPPCDDAENSTTLGVGVTSP
jgi:hypothetical protein